MLACACAYECNRFCVSACAVWCHEDESGACHALTGSVINYSFLLVHAQTHYEDPVRLSRLQQLGAVGTKHQGECFVPTAQPFLDMDAQREVGQ